MYLGVVRWDNKLMAVSQHADMIGPAKKLTFDLKRLQIWKENLDRPFVGGFPYYLIRKIIGY